MRIQQARRGWDSILLLAPEGQQLVSSRLPYGTPLLRVHEPGSHLRVVREKVPIVGTIRPPQRGGVELGFAVRVPVLERDAVKYVLTAIVDVASLAELVGSQLPASEEWTRTILDPAGTVAARTRNAALYIGNRRLRPFWNARNIHRRSMKPIALADLLNCIEGPASAVS